MEEQTLPPQFDPLVEALPEQAQTLLFQAYGIWQAGGWAMLAIATVALIMFAVGMNMYFKLLSKRFELSWRSGLILMILIATGVAFGTVLSKRKTDPTYATTLSMDLLNLAIMAVSIGAVVALVRIAISYVRVRGCGSWHGQIQTPEQVHGPVGKILCFVTGCKDVKETEVTFDEVRSIETKPFVRELMIMRVCVASAPLLGLLGTVTGMIATFDGLTQGSGGEKTKGMVASGISEALITTETGLVIALAGLFFQYQLSRKHQRYTAFLAHMESLCTQHVYKRSKQQTPPPPHTETPPQLAV